MFQNWKMIISLALPNLISFSTITVTGTINLIMVGQLGALIIAVVGVSNIIMYNAWALFSGIGHTVNFLVAQNFGANEMKKGIERTYISLYIGLFFGLLVFLFGLFFAPYLFQVMGGSPELVAAGADYLRIRFFAMGFSILNFILFGFMRGIGDTKTPMLISIVNNLLMILFTYGLTFGKFGLPVLGLRGAGWAIFIGEALAFLCCLYVFFVRLHPVYHTRSAVGANRAETALIVKESGKLGLQEFAMSVSMFIFTMFVTRLGTEALAANEVALNVMSFGFMPAFALGATATILVGQEIGKGRPERAKRSGTDTAVLGTILLLLLGTLEFYFAHEIARIFTTDPAVHQLAAQMIMVSAYLQLFDGFLNFYAGGLRGIGDTTFLLHSSLALSFLVFIPLAYLFTSVFSWGSIGAWVSLYTYLVVFGLAVMIRYYRTDWGSVETKRANI